MVQSPEEQTLRLIRHRLRRPTAVAKILEEHATDCPARSPSDYFSKRFPALAQRYGPPILESVETLLDQSTTTTPVALNEDFFGAAIGGDEELGHHVVFYLPEQQFYFFDSRVHRYEPTTEQKLVFLLSQYLIQCAAEMPQDVEIAKLFIELRKEDNLRKVVRRAKALLAADESFFGESSPNKRLKGPESHSSVAKVFAREILKPDPESNLTITECFETFNEFCQDKGLDPINRRVFKSLIAEVIREEFNLGLRHDVLGINNRQQHGWKGLVLDCRRN